MRLGGKTSRALNAWQMLQHRAWMTGAERVTAAIPNFDRCPKCHLYHAIDAKCDGLRTECPECRKPISTRGMRCNDGTVVCASCYWLHEKFREPDRQ